MQFGNLGPGIGIGSDQGNEVDVKKGEKEVNDDPWKDLGNILYARVNQEEGEEEEDDEDLDKYVV